MNAFIYCIRHKATGRCYVGHSVALRLRWAGHRHDLECSIHSSRHLQNAWKKYGPGEFAFEVLEECRDDQKLEREQHFIDTMNSVFNVARVVRKPRLGCKQPPHEIERVRQFMKGNAYTRGRIVPAEEKERRASFHRGRKRTAETAQRISAAKRGKPNPTGRPVSAETRQKISLANKGKPNNRLGAHHTEETRRLLSELNKARIARDGNHRSGTKHSPATIAKMRFSQNKFCPALAALSMGA